MTEILFWRCATCTWTSFRADRPVDHWAKRLDGQSRICRGPFEQWRAAKVA